MSAPPTKLSREERLAARLRENLHRRKAQARALDAKGGDAADSPDQAAGIAALPKGEPEG